MWARTRRARFDDSSTTITTYQMSRYPPDQVLVSVPMGSSEYSVFVADSLTQGERRRIPRELTESG